MRAANASHTARLLRVASRSTIVIPNNSGGCTVMQFGASIFFTEYSISPAELAVALEERGFDSLWVAEHSHIPVTRRFTLPGSMELTKQYYDVMDPLVTLTAAAVATRRLKLATAICLVIQRDTIQTAKLVASLDQVSGGRFIF